MSEQVVQVVVEQAPAVVAHVTVGGIGPQGPTGPPGVGSTSFVYEQTVPSSVWKILHNMAKFPSVIVEDSSKAVCQGAIEYNSNNEVTLTFSGAFSGKAYLN